MAPNLSSPGHLCSKREFSKDLLSVNSQLHTPHIPSLLYILHTTYHHLAYYTFDIFICLLFISLNSNKSPTKAGILFVFFMPYSQLLAHSRCSVNMCESET